MEQTTETITLALLTMQLAACDILGPIRLEAYKSCNAVVS